MVNDVPSQRKLKFELSQARNWDGSAASVAVEGEIYAQEARFERLSLMAKVTVLFPGVEPGVAVKVLRMLGDFSVHGNKY